jgi:hypothetical protein
MPTIIQEEFLDLIALIAKANHEIPDAVQGVAFHDVPQNRPAADFHHGLWAELRFRA